MDCQFQVGDKVVCVDGEFTYSPYPAKGDVCTITQVRPNKKYSTVYIVLEGYPDSQFWHECFRPVKTTKTDISIFTEIVRREFDVDKVVKKVSA